MTTPAREELHAALAELADAARAARVAGREAWPYRPDPAYQRRIVLAESRWRWASLARACELAGLPPP